MQKVSLKLSLFCAVASFASFSTFAGPAAELKELASRAVVKKWAKQTPKEIRSDLARAPEELRGALLKLLPFQTLKQLDAEDRAQYENDMEQYKASRSSSEPKRFLEPILIFENREVIIAQTEKKDKWYVKEDRFYPVEYLGDPASGDFRGVPHEKYALLMGTFQDIVNGPFRSLILFQPTKLTQSERQTLAESPVKRVSIRGFGKGIFENLFIEQPSYAEKPFFQNLRQLEFERIFPSVSLVEIIELMRTRPYFQALTHLVFTDECLGRKEFEALARDSFFHHLIHLELTRSLFQDEIEPLTNSDFFNQLIHLKVSGNRKTGDVHGLKAKQFKDILQRKGLALQYLDLSNNLINFDELMNYEPFEVNLENLTYLNLAGNEIGDEGVKFFTQSPFPFKKLETLTLPVKGAIGKANFKAIKKSKNFQWTSDRGSGEHTLRIIKPQSIEEKTDREKEKEQKS